MWGNWEKVPGGGWMVLGGRQSWDEWDFRQNGEKTPKACSGDKGVTQTG